jgi:hypothetical protein
MKTTFALAALIALVPATEKLPQKPTVTAQRPAPVSAPQGFEGRIYVKPGVL